MASLPNDSTSYHDHLSRMTWQRITQRSIPVTLVIALHIGALYLLAHGLNDTTPLKSSESHPKEVTVSLITVNNAVKPAPPPLPHHQPKIVPVIKKQVVSTPVKTPVIPHPAPAPLPPQAEKAVTAPSKPVDAALPQPVAPPPTESLAPSAPTAKATEPPKPKWVTTGVEYIRKPEQTYPKLSQRLGEEGKVVLRVLINTEGHPQNITVEKSSGHDRLDAAAREAVLEALFKPYIENGQAIPVYVRIPISYTLNNDNDE